MRPKGNAEELERRRRRAVQLMREGESPTLIARILGVSRQSLYRWEDPKRYPAFVVQQGKGRILVSELKTSAGDSDSIAARVLRNMTNWACAINR